MGVDSKTGNPVIYDPASVRIILPTRSCGSPADSISVITRRSENILGSYFPPITQNFSRLSIMRMFGGFDRGFLEEYHKHRPKSHPTSEYDKRQLLYELFHYLNHTCIFQVRSFVCGSAPPKAYQPIRVGVMQSKRLPGVGSFSCL